MDSEQTDTLDVAERLRQHIEKHPMHDGKDLFHVTISIGTATYPNDNGKLAECIRQADTALYQAKESGRNKVITSQPTNSQVIQLKS